jgi:hypothetical protein
MNDETLVMTATFRPADTPALVVRDEDVRILQYVCALVSWARPAHVRRIVFGENSNTRFDFSKIVEYVESAGKQIEVIVFDGNKQSARYGKGYGEGEILEYVARHSRLLNDHPDFYKVTGRLFVSNFDLISAATAGPDAFQRKQPKDARPRPCKIVTSFFKCSRELFETRLIDAYRHVDDPSGRFIEHVYYDQLRDVDVPGFPLKPALVGVQASTGRVYAPYGDDVVTRARSLFVSRPS